MYNSKNKKNNEQIANNEIESVMEKTRKVLGIAPEEYAIVKMNNTLGKCVNGKITINPELMQFKREIIEYVVAHEFCHLKYKTHGKRFYEIIEKHMPEYKNTKEKYKTMSFKNLVVVENLQLNSCKFLLIMVI